MLQKIGFQPGINKQISDTTAEGQWVDCDNVRFRYGTPEKIGGWKQLGDSKLTGAGRGLHHFVNSLARIAEEKNHHPDLNVGWCRVEVIFTSHDQGGVTSDCISMAKTVDKL